MNSDSPRGSESEAHTADRRAARTRSATRVLAARLLAVCAGLLFGLLLSEVALRLIDIEPQIPISKRRLLNRLDSSVAYHCYSSNPADELQPLPELGGDHWKLTTYTFEPIELPLQQLPETPWCVRYDFSSATLRDREYSPSAPEGVLRIAGIGDSFVFGEGVPEPLTLCRQLQGHLGPGVEVINAGVVGSNTPQECQQLRRMVADFECQRAVFVFIPNDIPLTVALEKQQAYINDLVVVRDTYLADQERQAWYTGHFRALHFIGQHLNLRRIHKETIQWYLDACDPQHNPKNLQLLEQQIRELATIPDCQVAFVVYPLMLEFENGYPLKPIHEYVARIARDAGLPVLDLLPHFESQLTASLWVHPTDHHPNGKAHTIAAKAVADWLKNEVPSFLAFAPAKIPAEN